MIPRDLKRAALALVLCAAASCSLMVDYDLEGKPCGNNKTCREGYVCTDFYGCQPADGDAGGAVQRDGGSRDGSRGDAEAPDAELDPPDAWP